MRKRNHPMNLSIYILLAVVALCTYCPCLCLPWTAPVVPGLVNCTRRWRQWECEPENKNTSDNCYGCRSAKYSIFDDVTISVHPPFPIRLFAVHAYPCPQHHHSQSIAQPSDFLHVQIINFQSILVRKRVNLIKENYIIQRQIHTFLE